MIERAYHVVFDLWRPLTNRGRACGAATTAPLARLQYYTGPVHAGEVTGCTGAGTSTVCAQCARVLALRVRP